jgi:hypothetical protein
MILTSFIIRKKIANLKLKSSDNPADDDPWSAIGPVVPWTVGTPFPTGSFTDYGME